MKPLNGNVMFEVKIKSDRSKSGLIVTSAEDTRMEKAKVVAVAKDVEGIKKGNFIYYKAYSISEIERGDKIFGFVKAEEVLAIE